MNNKNESYIGHGIDVHKMFKDAPDERQQKVLDGLIKSDVEKMTQKELRELFRMKSPSKYNN